MGIDPEGIEFDIEMGIDPERKEFEAILKWGSTPNDQQWSEERRRPTKWSERIEGKVREGKGREGKGREGKGREGKGMEGTKTFAIS